MSRKGRDKPFTEMTAAELAEATKEYDEEHVEDRFRPLSPKNRARWERMRPGKNQKKPGKNNKSKRPRAYIPTTALAKTVQFDKDMMRVTFADGRILCVPLVWFPVLRQATARQRSRCEIGGGGISLHWPELKEDISIAGLMAGVDWQSA